MLVAVALLLLVVGGAVVAAVLLRPPSFAGALTGAAGSAAGAPPARITAAIPTPTPTRSTPAPAPALPPVAAPQPSIDAPDSIWVVVNKLRPLDPIGHVPADLVDIGGGLQLRAEAAQAVAGLQAEAAAAGLEVAVQSAYRPYDRQVALFTDSVSRFGEQGAEQRSARPGHSEHQTGLAVDVGGGGCDIERCFGDTPEGRWVAANAHRSGFLVRYPAGSEQITGFQYEPWHLRYVGRELATRMHESGVATLEEFFGLPPAPGYSPG